MMTMILKDDDNDSKGWWQWFLRMMTMILMDDDNDAKGWWQWF